MLTAPSDIRLKAAPAEPVFIVGEQVASLFVAGNIASTAPTTAKPLSAVSVALVKGVTVKSAKDNTDYVYVGAAIDTEDDGFQLSAGEDVFVEVDNLNKVFVYFVDNNNVVSYIGT